MATSSKKVMMSLLLVTVVSLTAFSALARREPAAPRQGKLSPHADQHAQGATQPGLQRDDTHEL